MTGQRSPLAPFPGSLTAFSFFLFLISPSIVICLTFSLSLSSAFLSVCLPVSVSPHFFLHAVFPRVSVCPSVSRFFLNQFVSVEESGFHSVSISLSLVWSCVFLSLCVLVTDFLISLSWYISPWSLSPPSFPSLCFSLSLGPFQPLRTESSSLLIQVELGSGSRECPLYSHFLVILSLKKGMCVG